MYIQYARSEMEAGRFCDLINPMCRDNARMKAKPLIKTEARGKKGND